MPEQNPARHFGRVRRGCNMIVEELYDALIEAGASEEKSRAASRAIADMQGYFANIEKNISRLDQKVDRRISELDQKISELRFYINQRFTQVEGTLQLHKWMLGTMLAFIIAIFFKIFSL
jgi:hypothetical protein